MTKANHEEKSLKRVAAKDFDKKKNKDIKGYDQTKSLGNEFEKNN